MFSLRAAVTSGHAIDLFVNVLGMSFNEAMRQIVAEDNAGQFTE